MLIKVKVFANAKKEKIVEKGDGSLEIRVKEKPVDGQANKAVISALAEHFKISQSEIGLVKGAKSRNKIFEVKI